MKIGIIGLGYVGLPLSLQFSASGVSVIGFDVDDEKISSISRGQSYIGHIPSEKIAAQIAQGTFEATSDFRRVAELEALIICVPTPLKRNKEPNISYIIRTGETIAPHLSKGVLVILESTTYPGTTEEDLLPVLEKGSGLKAGSDFHLAFSPEREDPGNPESSVAKIPKVVGGYTPACLDKAVALYRLAVEKVIPVSNCRTAEATKLMENIFRSVNIALVNEMKVIYAAMKIDIWEVIEAAKTKPFGFMPFYPGPGYGGHCIPIDPFYLTWKAREYGQHTRFIELAGEINAAMPEYVVARTDDALNFNGKPIKGSRVLLIGLAYKNDVDDMRESPALVLMDLFAAKGAIVSYYDPHIPVVPKNRDHGQWIGQRSISWDEQTIRSYDVVVVSTRHSTVAYADLARWSSCIVDTRNALGAFGLPPHIVWKA